VTRFAANIDQIARWGEAVEQEIEDTQALAALPEEVRVFPSMGAREVLELVGCSEWQWKAYVKGLPEDRRPATTVGGQYRVTLEDAHALMEHLGTRPGRPPEVPRAMRIAVENFKGGAGKSATTLHLAISLARKGYRVLLVDTDPQATLSRMLGIQPAKLEAHETIAAAVGVGFEDRRPRRLTPRATYISGLSIIPASMELSEVEIEVIRRFRDNQVQGIERIFDDAFSQVDGDFDLMFLDFQPSFSMTQLLLLWAMDSLVIPLPTETADFAGTGDFLHQIAAFMRPLVSITGIDKNWDPALVVHTKRKKGADLVYNMAGATFGIHRPGEFVEDQAAVSSSLAVLRSVYEVGADQYDRRAIKRAREQYDVIADRVIGAVKERWAELSAAAGVA
jgi:chromosome partitioning protein